MPYYKITLIKKETYYVETDSHDEAVNEAIRLDTDGGDPWTRKKYYDEIESEELE